MSRLSTYFQIVMVSSCVAFGCTNRCTKDSGISFFRFPLKKPDLLHRWVQAVRCKNWKPTAGSRICSEHFESSCFVIRPGQIGKRLNENSVPTVFPAFPCHLQPKKQLQRKSPKKRKADESSILSSPSPTKISLIHSYASKITLETKLKQSEARISHLKKRVKRAKQNVYRRNLRIQNLLQTLKKQKLVSDEQHDLLENNFSSVAKELFNDQLRNSKGSHGNRYSIATKQFAVTLHYYSPKAYNFVRRVMHLPHEKHICKWNSSVNCEPGFLSDVIELLGKRAKCDKILQDVVLIIDAMAIRKGTWWDEKKTHMLAMLTMEQP